MSLLATTWQTVGPYFRIGLEHLNTCEIAPSHTPGERVIVEGRVLDGKGKPVPDAVIEIWQADANGRYAVDNKSNLKIPASSFIGFGRIPTNVQGEFRFTTIRPGPTPGPNGQSQAPHLAVRVMMRGLLRDLVTRMYFPSDETQSDPILQSVPGHRRATLIACCAVDQEDLMLWNIELQGDRETVFFDF